MGIQIPGGRMVMSDERYTGSKKLEKQEEKAMARHNEVTLYGQVAKPPVLLQKPQNDPNGKLIRVLLPLTVIRGIRDFGAKDQRLKLDEVIVMSDNERFLDIMRAWKQGDVITMRGTLITNRYLKRCTCGQCGNEQTFQGYSAYIYPIYARLVAQGYTPEQGLAELRRNAEVSNRITVIGTACSKPLFHRHERSGTPISSYTIDIKRKYRIKGVPDPDQHDFPIVKSYGKAAENDYMAIEEGGLVFIDGQLQVRNYDRTFICETCGAEIKKKDNVTEIVPYATEYLTGCHSMTDIITARGQAKEQAELQDAWEMPEGIKEDETGTGWEDTRMIGKAAK